MAKSATVVRDEKQGAQPVKIADKALNKVQNKVASQGSPSSGGSGAGNQLTGLYTRTVDFLRDVRGEMRKVVTPSRDEVRSMTIVVIITVFAFAAFFYVVDGVLGRVIESLLHWLGGTQ